jgi:UDP-3-O-[3-hydroxymyristoyl] glucosamine N-acyltransferase
MPAQGIRSFTLGELASHVGGRVAGDPQVLIRQVGSLERAGPGEIAFFAQARYKAKLAATHASAVVLAPENERLTSLPRLVADNPRACFARVSQLLNGVTRQEPGIHPSAVVASDAKLGARASIGPGCVIGAGVAIGDDSCLYARVVVYPGCTIGARAIIHAGAVIGADGFGFADDTGRWVKIPQVGRVVIGDDVEIGANSTIDRGAIDDTVIEDGVKIDNQVQIGHNVRIGAHSAITGCVGIAGSADIGRNCWLGAACVILGHLKIADGVHVGALTVITRSIRKPGTYTGLYPFDEHAEWQRNTAWIRRLGELADRVHTLEGRRPARKGKKHG